jgi:hypothetical protein
VSLIRASTPAVHTLTCTTPRGSWRGRSVAAAAAAVVAYLSPYNIHLFPSAFDAVRSHALCPSPSSEAAARTSYVTKPRDLDLASAASVAIATREAHCFTCLRRTMQGGGGRMSERAACLASGGGEGEATVLVTGTAIDRRHATRVLIPL